MYFNHYSVYEIFYNFNIFLIRLISFNEII